MLRPYTLATVLVLMSGRADSRPYKPDGEFSTNTVTGTLCDANNGAENTQPSSLADQGYLQIGAVSVRFAEHRLSFKTPTEAFHFNIDADGLDYAFALRTHRPELQGCDGVVETNSDVRPIPATRPLMQSDIPRFSFFSAEPGTVGFLVGSAGASGASGQEMVLLDTVSGAKAVIHLDDMCMPLWLDGGFPPAYAETTTRFALGSHALHLGAAPRIWRVFSFKNGWYERDPQAESRLCLEKFEAVRLTLLDQRELRKDDLNAIGRDAGERFLHYVYYGTRSLNTNAVQNLLRRVSAVVRDEVQGNLSDMLR